VGARGPGWATVLGLALVAITFSVVHPVQLIAIPLALLLVALPPRRAGSMLVAVAAVALVFMGPRGTLWHVERGWALLLGGWFVVAVVALPRAPFTSRAVAATVLAMATAAGVLVIQGGWPALDHTVAAHYRDVADAVARTWPVGGPETQRMLARAGEFPGRIFPGLTAIGSVAALGVAWWLSGRVSGTGRRLGSLPEFRFPDALVWVLIAGFVLLLAPVADWAPRLGSNVVVFMGALYALRGLAVMVAVVLTIAGSQVLVLVALGVVGILLYPILVAGTLLLGVTDTWLDLRSSRRVVNDEG
jgi:hypothetical protein